MLVTILVGDCLGGIVKSLVGVDDSLAGVVDSLGGTVDRLGVVVDSLGRYLIFLTTTRTIIPNNNILN